MRIGWRDRAPADWGELLAADPSASPAHRPEVWAAFAAVLPGCSARVAVVEEGGRTVGGAPVVIERRGGLHWLHALPMLLPGTPLARAGAHERVDAALADAFAALARELGAAGGEWAFWRPAGPAPGDALERVAGETRQLVASVIDLGDGLDAARRRIDRKHRQEMRRAQESGLAFAAEPAALEEAYALHVAQSRAWRGHRALPLELSRRLLAAGGDAPVARLFTLREPRGLVAAALALDGPHETFVWWSGTHAAGRRRHAFPLLLWNIVEWAAAAGRARVNLGASTGLGAVSSFKQSLGAADVRYPVRWLDARHAPPAARAAAALQAWLRRGRPRGEAA